MKIGFTGTQSGMTNFQKSMVETILKAEKCEEFLHGDCVGSDYEANNIAREFIPYITIFPPDNPNKRAWCFNPMKDVNKKWEWEEFRELIEGNLDNLSEDSQVIYRVNKVRWAPRAPYLERNKHIVDNCEIMIACPKEVEHTVRSGTWSTIRYAWRVKRKITIIPPIVRDEVEESVGDL